MVAFLLMLIVLVIGYVLMIALVKFSERVIERPQAEKRSAAGLEEVSPSKAP